MDKMNIIYDHYKECVSDQKRIEETRNKLFIIIVATTFIMLLMTIYPDNLYSNIKELIYLNYTISINFELYIIEFFLWFLILYNLVRYYQINSNIEKNYKYIHELEELLSTKYKVKIQKEGKNYLNIYPTFLKSAYFFYKFCFPIALDICLLIKIINDLKFVKNISIIITEIILCITIFILNYSYIKFNIDIRKEGKNEN